MLSDAHRPVTRIEARDLPDDDRTWPYSLPVVRQLLADGLDLPPGVTFLVGENGSGKSTVIEAIAGAVGLSAEGGSRGARHSTRVTESELGDRLRVHRGIGSSRYAYFLRAETMHGFYTYLEDNPGSGADVPFHRMSHGESFNALIDDRMLRSTGFYCLDEPESALSFTSCLALVGTLADMVSAGSQVLCATHSPMLCSLPGATILELGEWGIRPSAWDDLALVIAWRAYLDEPARFLRHVLD